MQSTHSGTERGEAAARRPGTGGATVTAAPTAPAASPPDRRYVTALDSMAEAYLLTSTVRGRDGAPQDFRVVLANVAACQLFGLEREHLVGQSLCALSAWHPYLGVVSLCRHALDTGGPIVTELVSHSAGDHAGELAEHSLRVAPTPDGVALTWYDITERRRVERTLAAANTEVSDHAHRMEATVAALKRGNTALERLNRQLATANEDLETFAYVCSHDLSEPLRIINGFATLFDETYGELVDQRGQEYLAFIVDGTVRMRRLIDDLLVYSRVGRVDAELDDVDLDEVVRRITHEQTQLTPAEVEVSIHVRDGLPPVCASLTEVEQLMGNLLGNAVKFRAPDRPCRVEVYARPAAHGYVEVHVEDNGIGVPPGQRERIFKMFQRLHGPESCPGTGIGLAVSRKIVERLGGRLWVEDAAELGGLHLAMTLPLAECAPNDCHAAMPACAEEVP